MPNPSTGYLCRKEWGYARQRSLRLGRVADNEAFHEPIPHGGIIFRAAIAYLAEEISDKGFAAVGKSLTMNGKIADLALGYLHRNLNQQLPNTYLAPRGTPILAFTMSVVPV